VEHVDLPNMGSDSLPVPGLFDQWPQAETIEEDRRIGDRDGVLKLQAADVVARSLDAQVRPIAGDADSHHAFLVSRQIALAVGYPVRRRVPNRGIDEELAFDLGRHGVPSRELIHLVTERAGTRPSRK